MRLAANWCNLYEQYHNNFPNILKVINERKSYVYNSGIAFGHKKNTFYSEANVFFYCIQAYFYQTNYPLSSLNNTVIRKKYLERPDQYDCQR